jgi:hypothetical protein
MILKHKEHILRIENRYQCVICALIRKDNDLSYEAIMSAIMIYVTCLSLNPYAPSILSFKKWVEHEMQGS